MDNLINFEIQYWNADKNKWDMQSGGSNTFINIVNDWQGYTKRNTSTHYRLILIVKQEIVLAESG